MSLASLFYLGSGAAALGFAVGALFFLAWAFIGQRGDLRRRRLRFALSSAALSAASVLSGIALFYVVLLPGVMQMTAPDFAAPYQWCSAALVAAVPLALYASAILLIRAINHTSTSRSWALRMSLGCLLASLLMFVAGYLLIYRVQVPAFDRYVLIENRDWRTHVGDQAPDISLVMLDGSTKRLSDFRGQLVLLNFFATWCGPCNAELPHLQSLWNTFKANDRIRMFVVDREESPSIVEAFVSEHGYTFPVALDADATAFKQFADETIPRTYLIGRDGRILFQTLGFADGKPVYERELATLRQMIDDQLASNPQP